MLLIPEGGGGCSCGGWMETSLGFIPNSFKQKIDLMSNYLLLFCIISSLTTDHIIAAAEDWSTYRHDNRRSGVTKESPVFIKLKTEKII